jgi:hypothetical protein
VGPFLAVALPHQNTENKNHTSFGHETSSGEPDS